MRADIFFAFPHVAVSSEGEEGLVQRIGREKISSACGALLAIQGEAKGWAGDKNYDDDAEYTVLRNKVLHKVSASSEPAHALDRLQNRFNSVFNSVRLHTR